MSMYFAIGDIHGDAFSMYNRLSIIEEELVGRPLSSCDTVFCLGDVGLRYGEFVSYDLYRIMGMWDCEFAIIRGNHDTRYCRDAILGVFDASPIVWNGGRAYRDNRQGNIVYLDDTGGLYHIGNADVLVIPGAYSVDGAYRKAVNAPFEADEQLSYCELDEIVALSEQSGVDVVMSHTCPYSWIESISDLFLPGVDQSAVDNGMEKALDVVLGNVGGTCREWLFGHYHDDRIIGGTIGRMLYREPIMLEL